MEPNDADSATAPPPELSVVVPCFNEREVLPELYGRLRKACEQAGVTYEIIFIDDGSRDGTPNEIKRLSQEDSTVRGVLLSRNFGHQAAVSAGYDHARGRAVLVMDADLQHPPELIPEFLAQWRAGYDVVYAYRRNVPARWGYRMHNWLCNVTIPREAADFRLLDRVVVEALRRMPERNRFVRGLVAWLGFRQIGIPYDQAERVAGRPSYSLRKHLNIRFDSVFSFSTVPLRISVYLGLVTLVLGIIYAAYILAVLLIRGRAAVEPGWPALIITVLVLGGVQLLCLGMVAEYVGRVYEEVKQRPLYVVRELTEG
ncbi:MAG: glycosyltransferase family 2 protein [Phycisphaerae bacterium]|nr:glycosyltransferase family 2 protein [Phycisphaerae bacterium]